MSACAKDIKVNVVVVSFHHNTCENRLEEVQGAETSSLFPPPFFQDTWSCVQHVCAERNAPCQ